MQSIFVYKNYIEIKPHDNIFILKRILERNELNLF